MRVIVIDRDERRGDAFGDRLRRAHVDEVFVWTRRGDAGRWRFEPRFPRADEPRPHLVLHHYRDRDRRVELAVGGVEVWYGGAGAEPDQGTGWHVHEEVLDASVVSSWPDEWVAELVAWARVAADERGRVALPHLLGRTNLDAFGALLPFGVLLDGYIALGSVRDPQEWFTPAVVAARGAAVDVAGVGDRLWNELAQSDAAVRRLREMLGGRAEYGAHGFAEIVATAEQLGWLRCDGDDPDHATMLHQAALKAVRAAWEELCSSRRSVGAPLGDAELRRLVHDASIGFHVLAAVHL